jgi:transcriptional regulator with XRE-family HTH domain
VCSGAAVLGVKQLAVARIEAGKNISLKTLGKYAKILGRRIKIDFVHVSAPRVFLTKRSQANER